MGLSNDMRLLVEIAHMYYDEGAKQEEVASKFNISRSLVSKYLAKARELGLVEIIIHDEQLHLHRHLEEKFRRRYPIQEIICVSSDNLHNSPQLQRRLGTAAAKYLGRMIKPNHVVAVAPGAATHEVAANFSPSLRMPTVTFVPMAGGMGIRHTDIQANVICDIFAKRCGGERLELHAPLLLDSPDARDVFLRQPLIRDVYERAKVADIALIEIGGKPTYFEMTGAYLHKIDPAVQVDATPVSGDICYNFIDENGKALDCEWNRRLLALRLEEIQKIPLVIAVSGGPDKIGGIQAALNSNLFDVLLTDEDTARSLI